MNYLACIKYMFRLKKSSSRFSNKNRSKKTLLEYKNRMNEYIDVIIFKLKEIECQDNNYYII